MQSPKTVEDLGLDEGTLAAIARADVDLAGLVRLAAAGNLQSIQGVGAGRAAAIDVALAAAQIVDPPFPTSPAAPDQAGRSIPIADPGPDPAPRATSELPDEPTFTTYAGQVATCSRARLLVAGIEDGASKQAWFVRDGLSGTVVDALELVVTLAGESVARTVFVLADEVGVQKFVAAGGSGRYGHKEVTGTVVAE